ncbi:hypothetical protein C8T65DRAFT_550398, partial [Cerioporus squamosus]
NVPLLHYENDLFGILNHLRALPSGTLDEIEALRSSLLDQVYDEIARLECLKESEWHRQRAGRQFSFPTRKYLHQRMNAWVARFLCRPGLEELLESAKPGEGDMMEDFWDGLAIKDFLGPDGEMPYMRAPPNETRLVFALGVDGFNPYQSKTAKQSVSSTAIYMVCMNLPLHLRFLPENMYLVGVIP